MSTTWTAVVFALAMAGVEPEWAPAALARRPVSVASLGNWILTANRDSGTISVVDVGGRRVIAEVTVGKRLASLATLTDGRTVVAVDSDRHELVWLERKSNTLSVEKRWKVAPFPADVVVGSGGRRVAVASLWSWEVTLYSKSLGDVFEEPSGQVIQLPFAPRRQWFSPDERRLIVADAFGDRLAVVDCDASRVVAVYRIDGHNIGGMATSHDGRQLLIAHQVLHSDKSTTADNVFWGAVLNNSVQTVPVERLLAEPATSGEPDETARLLERGDVLPLGEPGHGTGDPTAIWVSGRGQTIVCLSGVNEIAVRSDAGQPMRRAAVGRRPVAVCADSTGRWAVVANQFDDSLSVVDLATLNVVDQLSLGPTRPLAAAERGEVHFYDARLSLDGWFSCHSCHVDGHTNQQLNDNLGDESFGAPKRVLSLLGVADTGPWLWNGQQKSLRDQVRKSIHRTMRGDDLPADDPRVVELEAYIRTLRPPPPAPARGDQANSQPSVPASVARGQRLFHAKGCADCHSPPTYTSADAWDVGIHDEHGNQRFNPPSLRGVSQRGPYFHDNRAARLRDVFAKHSHGGGELNDRELNDLLAFLNSL